MINSAFNMRERAFKGSREDDSYSKSFQTKSSREVTLAYQSKNRKENIGFWAPLKTTHVAEESDPTKRYQLDGPDGLYLVGGHQKLMEAISKAASELQSGETITIDVPDHGSRDDTHKRFNDRDQILPRGDRESMEHMGRCTSVTVGPVDTTKDSKETLIPLVYNFNRDFRVHTGSGFKRGTHWNTFAYQRDKENQYAAFNTPLEVSYYPYETNDSERYRVKNPEVIPFECSTEIADAVTAALCENQERGSPIDIPFPKCVSAISNEDLTRFKEKHLDWPERLTQAFNSVGSCQGIIVKPFEKLHPLVQPRGTGEVKGLVDVNYLFHRQNPSQIDPPGFWRQPTQQSE